MSSPDPRALKDDAAEAVAKGKWKKALECYLALEKAERKDGVWPQKAGEALKRLGRKAEAIDALDRAAEIYSRSGFLLKGIAVCKLILEIEPNHTATQAKLAALHSARGIPVTGTRRSSATSGPATGVAEPATAAPALAAGAAAPTPPSAASGAPVASASGVVPEPSAAEPAAPSVPSAVEPAAPSVPSAAEPAAPSVPIVVEPAAPSVPIVVEPAAPSAPSAVPTPVLVVAPAPVAPAVPAAALTTPVPARAPATAGLAPRTIPPGAALVEVSLGKTMPGARRSVEMAAVSEIPVYEIPLVEADFADLEIAVSEPDGAESAARSALPRTPLFSSLDERRLHLLIDRVRLVQLEPGQVLFSQGDPGDALYVVAGGEMAVRVRAEGQEEGWVEVARLREGAFFGEIALLTHQLRSATLVATTAADLLAIDREIMSDLVEDSPEVLGVLLGFLRDRLLDTLVGTSPLFAPFSDAERTQLAGRFRFLEVEPGATLLEQGQHSPALYILLAGQAAVLANGAIVGELQPGDVFGEQSLLEHVPAATSVRAASKAFALALPRADFTEVIMTHPQVLEYVNGLADTRQAGAGATAAPGAGMTGCHLRMV